MIHQLWLDIKAHNLPAMDIQNQKLINEFKQVHFQILSGEKWKIKTFTHLRATIQSRIQQIDSFYQENINDPSIHFSQKIKLKLKQALHLRLRNPQGPVEYIQPPADLHRTGVEALAAEQHNIRNNKQKPSFAKTGGEYQDGNKRQDVAEQQPYAMLHSKMKISPVRGNNQKKQQQPGQNTKSKPNVKTGGVSDVFRIQLTPQQYKIFLAKKQIALAKQGFNTQQIELAISNLQITAQEG